MAFEADPGDSLPRRLTYRQIADDLADRIAAGEYAPGDQLPTYPQLAELYSVSYATAHRAITMLQARGIVRGEQGRGVFVEDDVTPK